MIKKIESALFVTVYGDLVKGETDLPIPSELLYGKSKQQIALVVIDHAVLLPDGATNTSTMGSVYNFQNGKISILARSSDCTFQIQIIKC